jgi:hypothetical protein
MRAEWGHAWASHGPAPEKIGFIYMLAGDTGASNTDPYATEKNPDNHWVQTGPHVMIVGAAVKTMTGHPKTPDADPTKPYVMWPGCRLRNRRDPVTQLRFFGLFSTQTFGIIALDNVVGPFRNSIRIPPRTEAACSAAVRGRRFDGAEADSKQIPAG